MEFSGIPSATTETAALISKSTSSLPNEGETTTVTFGARIGAELEPGQYEGSVMFTVVPELMPEEPEKPDIAFFTIENMQDMTADVCASATTPTAEATLLDTDGTHADDTSYVPRTTLTDSRDGKTYTVSKLADGNCWMSQDLNYVLSTSEPLTSEKSDLPEGTSWTPEYSTQTETGIKWSSQSYNTARSYTNGIRTYYNFRAATAGTTSSDTSARTQATGSVCPKGWKLPDGDWKGEYDTLISTAYGIKNDNAGATKIRQEPLNFAATGYYGYDNGSGPGTTSYGYYWSNKTETISAAYILLFSSSEVKPYNYYTRDEGLAVRCLAR